MFLIFMCVYVTFVVVVGEMKVVSDLKLCIMETGSSVKGWIRNCTALR